MMEDDPRIKIIQFERLDVISMKRWDNGDGCEFLDIGTFGEQIVYDFYKVKTSTCHFREIFSP